MTCPPSPWRMIIKVSRTGSLAVTAPAIATYAIRPKYCPMKLPMRPSFPTPGGAVTTSTNRFETAVSVSLLTCGCDSEAPIPADEDY